MLIFGRGEQAKFEESRGQFSKRIQAVYDETHTYHDGKWLMFPISNGHDIDAFIKLLAFKRRPVSDGSVVPADAVVDLAPLALRKLGVKMSHSQATTYYNDGKSSQVPTGRVIGVNKRVRRNISYNGYSFKFEVMNKRKS